MDVVTGCDYFREVGAIRLDFRSCLRIIQPARSNRRDLYLPKRKSKMTDQLSIANVHVNQRGSRTAALLNNKERYYVTFNTPAACLYPPSSFDKDESASRMGVHFEATDELTDFFLGFDKWAVEYLCEHSERLFGKAMSKDQVESCYHSCLKEGKGCRFKINTPASPTPTRIWNDAGEQLPWPSNWNDSYRIRCKISHLWQMGTRDKSFGFVVICENLLPQVTVTASPWAK